MANYRWSTIPDNIKTKGTWSNEGRRVKKDEVGVIHSVYTGGRWKKFEFFTIEQTVEKKKVNRTLKPPLEFSVENLAKSLYIINKSAKTSRDTKNESYYDGNHTQVASSKTREKNLYTLKDKVLKKAISDSIAEVKGYHVASKTNYKLALISIGGLTFHQPIQNVSGLERLGEIDVISKDVNEDIKSGITFYQAKELLESYIKSTTPPKR